MPYIKSERRHAIDVMDETPQTSGELNYAVTNLIVRYLKLKGKSYATFNDISGALTEALAEFRRRIVAPYEDGKILDNGDVYEEGKTEG